MVVQDDMLEYSGSEDDFRGSSADSKKRHSVAKGSDDDIVQALQKGDSVEALSKLTGKWYPATIEKEIGLDTFLIIWADGDRNDNIKKRSQLRLDHKDALVWSPASIPLPPDTASIASSTSWSGGCGLEDETETEATDTSRGLVGIKPRRKSKATAKLRAENKELLSESLRLEVELESLLEDSNQKSKRSKHAKGPREHRSSKVRPV